MTAQGRISASPKGTAELFDDEKGAALSPAPSATDAESAVSPPGRNGVARPAATVPSRLGAFNARIEGLAGFEARGIARVPPEERRPPSLSDDMQVAIMWFSANISLNNLAAAMLGPLVLNLGFLDCALLAVSGALVGSLTTAYMSIWGPQSGNRTMVVLRFFMGYWPSKIPCFLNVVLMVGYATIDGIIGGQVLSAVSGGRMTIVVGIVVVSVVCWVVAVFGMALFHRYERYSWLPQVLALFVLIGVAGPYFDASSTSKAQGALLAAQRLSFFNICLYVPNSWAAAASDFYVYYPEKTSRLKIFCLTLVGLWTAFCLVYLIAIGLGTGVANMPAWSAANGVSSGALIVAGYEPLGGFGRFCSVVVALGVIANSIPSTYSAALGCQTLGRYGKAVPRWVWSSLLVLVELVLAVAGREHLFLIFQNFLALMGYWVVIMVVIVLEEHLLFRRRRVAEAFDWSRCEDRAHLPAGWAALAAFLLGWVGAVLGMSQAWYVGPLAKLAATADVGLWIGCGFTLVTFAPLRHLELKLVGR
ncbi:purine-cytosine permease family protein [Hirsutella rhossiliensis]|uniref:Permease for cytosine/purines, uracil, thiamine, allantoin n=1 Tax=Hirsutella rhossiliensis TaxID=111463 RepID=A0A9P8MPA4_9HYPO|nr:permease for cytosine/purines, uracil, thiamine, allantoin [Hirsutella rhossiliensis]KAH0958937.1 permease for cytosine/purines, uracil, thiamine, allantoin [Hirsutella rhossiliensis]